MRELRGKFKKQTTNQQQQKKTEIKTRNESSKFQVLENNSKWKKKRQKTNLQNIQAAHAAQYQKNEQPNQKGGKRTQ